MPFTIAAFAVKVHPAFALPAGNRPLLYNEIQIQFFATSNPGERHD